jgi:2,4-diaminopentanoate dehydrogenase
VRKRVRVLHYGVGPIGASIARLARQKQAIEIIGAVDIDPAKAGRDLGEVAAAPDAPWGVTVSASAEEMLAHGPDVVIHSTTSVLPGAMGQLYACLSAGACIVSTCEELSYPFRKYPELASQLDEAAKEEGVALVGAGINPGFVLDKLVLTLSAVSQRVDRVRAIRIVDASNRRLPLQHKIGVGLSREEFDARANAGSVKHHGLPESVAMVADGLGFILDEISETIEPVIAEKALRSPYAEVAAGAVAGIYQVARGMAGGDEKIHLELKMYVGAENSEDTITLEGEPDITMTIPGGTHGDIATAAVVVNTIPWILAAPAGLRTARDLPLGFFSPGAAL